MFNNYRVASFFRKLIYGFVKLESEIAETAAAAAAGAVGEPDWAVDLIYWQTDDTMSDGVDLSPRGLLIGT